MLSFACGHAATLTLVRIDRNQKSIPGRSRRTCGPAHWRCDRESGTLPTLYGTVRTVPWYKTTIVCILPVLESKPLDERLRLCGMRFVS